MAYRDRVDMTKKWVGRLEFEKGDKFTAEAVPGMSTIRLRIKTNTSAEDLSRIIAMLQKVQKEALAYHKQLYGTDVANG